MKILISVFLIFSFFHANELKIQDYYLIDNTNSLELKNIVEEKNTFNLVDFHNFGAFKNTIWLKMKVSNTTSSVIEKRVYNKSPVLDYVDVYVFKEKRLSNTYTLGDKVDHKDRDNIFRINYFDITLNPFEEVEIFIKQKTAPPMNIKWNFTNKEYFSQHYMRERTIYLIFVGIFIFPLIISFCFYIALKDKAYLIYCAFTLSTMIYQLIRSGFIYELNIHHIFNDTVFYIAANVMCILFIWFPLVFFKFKKDEYKKLLFMLKGFVFIIIFYNILFFVGIIKDHSAYVSIPYLLLFITSLVLLVRILLNKKKGAWYYFIAALIVYSGATYSLASTTGLKDEVGDYDYYINTIAVAIQDLLLGIMIVQSTLFMKRTHDKNQELLHEYSKLSFIGQTMINISHQWKTPINAIYNSINHIEVAREFQDKDIDLIINKNLKEIKETTEYLNHTALSHLNFYKSNVNKETINLYDELSFLIKLVQSEFSKKSIDIKLDFNKNITLEIQKNYFLNVMMILFENSYKIFEQRNVKNPNITIEVFKSYNFFSLKFYDNAKGSKDDTSTLFDKDYSMSDSTGLGLYIAKEIVLSKLEGEISAENTEDGICFTLAINLGKRYS